MAFAGTYGSLAFIHGSSGSRSGVYNRPVISFPVAASFVLRVRMFCWRPYWKERFGSTFFGSPGSVEPEGSGKARVMTPRVWAPVRERVSRLMLARQCQGGCACMAQVRKRGRHTHGRLVCRRSVRQGGWLYKGGGCAESSSAHKRQGRGHGCK